MTAVAVSREKYLQLAKLTSMIFHPYILLAFVLALTAYHKTSQPFAWIKWTLLAFIPIVVIPLLYVVVRASLSSQPGTRYIISRSHIRDNPTRLFIMAVLFGIPSTVILYYLDGPRDLIVIILGVTAVMLLIAMINLVHRASFHVAMVTGILTSLWFLFGPVSLVTITLIPILGISRYQLGMHTLRQVVSGFFIGLTITAAVFYGLRLAS